MLACPSGVDPQLLRQHRPAGREQPPFEEFDRFRSVLEDAVRFGFDVQMDEDVVARSDVDERLSDLHDIPSHRFPHARSCRGHPRFVGEGCRGHAAVHACRQELRENLNEVQRVLHARGIAPVGRVDVGLHRRAVKRAERKAVDDCNVQPFAIEKRPELGQPIAGEQLACLPCR